MEKGWLEAACPAPYLGLVRSLSEKNGVDPAFVYGIMKQESDFDEAAVSPAGARGLMCSSLSYTAAKLAAESGQPAPSDAAFSTPSSIWSSESATWPSVPRSFSRRRRRELQRRRGHRGGWIKAWGPLDEEQFIAMIPYADPPLRRRRPLEPAPLPAAPRDALEPNLTIKAPGTPIRPLCGELFLASRVSPNRVAPSLQRHPSKPQRIAPRRTPTRTP